MLLTCFAVICAGFGSEYCHAQGLATLYSTDGAVQGQVAPNTTWTNVKQGQGFQGEDAVRTSKHSRAGVKFQGGYLIRMNENTTIHFASQSHAGEASRLSLTKGVAHFFSNKPQQFPKISTPQVTASVRGTEFVITVSSKKTVISVLDGGVIAENEHGSLQVAGGEEAVVKTGEAPLKQLLVRPLDAVQWALFYPPVTDLREYADLFTDGSPVQMNAFQALVDENLAAASELASGVEWRDAVLRSMISYKQGNIVQAFKELDTFGNPHFPALQLYLAGLHLAVGEIEKAQSLHREVNKITGGPLFKRPIEKQTKNLDFRIGAPSLSTHALSPKIRGILYSQQAVIEIVRNEKKKGLAFATQAVEVDAKSPSALLAMSFAKQAYFDLDEARLFLEKALALSPRSSLIRVRLAEILLGFGETEKALALLHEAGKISQHGAHALSLIGFAELLQKNTSQALQLFQAAIKKDQSFALSRYGLGLALIHKGDLLEGREQLQLAAHLEPNVSLYRSYLGKAYYEQEDYRHAAAEYERAMALDPNDPTPYLYRSFLNLTEHRPIPALRDLESSFARNDHRAVYRSRLLLDQDAATRSSGLGQIYNRLGFSERARVEALKSLQKDYSNYSAHFLLADVLSQTHLNSRAQAAENLLGRLLVPVTFNSNNINIGQDASLNEYTSLFERPVNRTNLETTVNSQSAGVQGLIEHNRVSETLGVNVGYTGAYQHGFRDNDWFRFHQGFMLGQYQLQPDDTLVWDTAVSADDKGDLIVDYDPYSEDKDLNNHLDSYLGRVGYHKKLAPGSDLLAQVVYNYGDFDKHDANNQSRLTYLNVTEAGVPVLDERLPFDGKTTENLNTKQHFVRGDLQYLFSSPLVSAIVGYSGRFEDDKSKERGLISDPGDRSLDFLRDFTLSSSAETAEHSEEGFVYSTLHAMPWLDINAGLVYTNITLSENDFDPPFVDFPYNRSAWSPKAGFTLELTPEVTLRAAFAKTLDRTGRGELGSLEPTFVGGFNQVFDGVAGSSQRFGGIGVDTKLSSETYFGVNYQRRELDAHLPVLRGGLDFDRNASTTILSMLEDSNNGAADVDSVRAYAYQIFGDSLSGTLDSVWEHFNDLHPFPDTDTVRVAPRLTYFRSSGLSAFSEAVWRYQERGGAMDPKETNNFWVFNTGGGYEFDKRRGGLMLVLKNIFDKDFKYAHIQDERAVRPKFGAEMRLSFNF